MVLSREMHRALTDIVGTENISEDPTLLDTYRYPLYQTSNHLGPFFGEFTPRGQAILLPGSTGEVQEIVKLCNRHKVKVKASGTFWSAMGFPSDENTIQLDMSRMDRILEIDAKNMMTVIEPGVIGAVLQAEVMKLGLNTHIHGAGSSCSLLASATSYNGMGPDSIYLGTNSENLLALEWVLPTGEVLMTGSAGSGFGWFHGEGPGPSLRGIVRGALGGEGALGVFTKVALKLYPWPGPPVLPVEGTVPAYRVSLPDNFRAYTLAFPTWKAWADGCHKIWDTEIGYIAHRQFNMFGRDLKFAVIKILTDPSKTLGDLEILLEDPEVRHATESMKRDFQIVLAAMTPGDLEWQEKALDRILTETGGWKAEAMTDPAIEKWALLYLIRLGHKNLNNIFAGSYDGSFGMAGPPDFGTAHIEEVAEFQAEWEKKGANVNAGGDNAMGGIAGMGGGGSVNWENFTSFDPHDRDSTEGTFTFFEAAQKFGQERKLGAGMERLNEACRGPDGRQLPDDERRRLLSRARQPSVFRFQAKIKAAFDPNNLGDSYYRTLEEPEA